MKRSLALTGITGNAMALIAPGAFLWTTFQVQAAQTHGAASTAPDMWTGLVFSLVLALLTAYSYAELARIYPDAGPGSSYYFAEAALLDKDKLQHQRFARAAKLSVGWISHLYYWIYPGIMVAFTATLFGYIYLTLVHHQLTALPLSSGAVAFAAEALRPEKDIKRGVLRSLITQGGLCYMFEYVAATFAVGGATISGVDTAGKPITGYAAAGVSGAPIGDMLKTVGDKMLGHT